MNKILVTSLICLLTFCNDLHARYNPKSKVYDPESPRRVYARKNPEHSKWGRAVYTSSAIIGGSRSKYERRYYNDSINDFLKRLNISEFQLPPFKRAANDNSYKRSYSSLGWFISNSKRYNFTVYYQKTDTTEEDHDYDGFYFNILLVGPSTSVIPPLQGNLIIPDHLSSGNIHTSNILVNAKFDTPGSGGVFNY